MLPSGPFLMLNTLPAGTVFTRPSDNRAAKPVRSIQRAHGRFGSKADLANCPKYVRFKGEIRLPCPCSRVFGSPVNLVAEERIRRNHPFLKIEV